MLIVESLGRTEKCENVMYNYSYRIIKNQLVFQEEDNLELQSQKKGMFSCNQGEK